MRFGLLAAASLLALSGHAHAGSAASFDTPEYYASGGLAQIHADQAYALGYTGAGTTIAIFDTGINPAHPEFAGKTITGYDYAFNTSNLSDLNGHGTFDAGLAAADRNGTGMQGVAYNANLMAFDILIGADVINVNDRMFAGVQQMIANNVRIASNSWVTFFFPLSPDQMASLHSNFTDAENHGVIFVFAAGNFSDTKPWDPADTPEYFPDLQKQFIAVTAVDQNNKIASFSNQCGQDAAWCISAPGVNAYSTSNGGGYAISSGTSMATPLVSGTLALVEQAFPYMTSEQMVQTVLTTATPIGPAYIYGHGLLNAGAAVRGPGSFDMDWAVDTAGYNSIWSNNISGTGGLTKSGAGMLVLNGHDGYSGATIVNGGTLEIGDAAHRGASIASNVTVNGGGNLSGHGTIHGGVTNNGAVTPGGSIGTLSVYGNYTQGSTGTLSLDVGPNAVSQLLVLGTANLDGRLDLNYLPGDYMPTVRTLLLTVGGISGNFASVTSTGAPDMLQFVSYLPTAVDLTLQPASDVVVTSLSTAAIESAHRATGEVLSHAGLDRSGAETRSGVWLDAQGQFDQYRTSVPGQEFSTDSPSLLAGIDHSYDSGLRVGAAGGYSHINLQQSAAQASGAADQYQASLYGGFKSEGMMFSGSAGYTWAHFHAHRGFSSTLGPQTASASFDGRIMSAAVQAEKRLSLGALSLTPRAGLDYAHLDRDGTAESGSPAFDLSYASGRAESLRPFAGLELSATYRTDGGAEVMPAMRIGYSHEVLSISRGVVASLQRGSNALESFGLSPSRDLLTVGGRIEVQVESQIYLHAEASASAPTGNHMSQTVSAAVEYRF